MEEIFNEQELMVNVMIFLLLFSIDDKDTRGKRVRKKIIRNIKFKLAEFRNSNPTRYLELVNKSSDLLKEIGDEFLKREDTVSGIIPSSMIDLLYFKYPDLVSKLNISLRDKENLTKSYRGTNLMWNTIKYTNVMVERANDFLGIENPVWVDDEIAPK